MCRVRIGSCPSRQKVNQELRRRCRKKAVEEVGNFVGYFGFVILLRLLILRPYSRHLLGIYSGPACRIGFEGFEYPLSISNRVSMHISRLRGFIGRQSRRSVILLVSQVKLKNRDELAFLNSNSAYKSGRAASL